jgi:excisionase family DNA binding protein
LRRHYITIAEAAEYLQISDRTVRRLIGDGELTSRRRQRRGTAEAGAGPVNGGVREHSRLEEYARGG